MRTTIVTAILALTALCSSCSSGDSDDDAPSVEIKSTISGKLTVNDTDAWPTGTKKLVFRGYQSTDRSDIAFEKTLVKAESGVINFRIEDAPVGALSDIEVAVVNDNDPNDFDTRLYYGSLIVKSEDDIQLPDMSINLSGDAPEFLLSKIEDKIFAPKCFSCHNSTAADRDLDLSKWQTYSHTVNVKSQINPNKILIKPGDAASSFLYQILENPELTPDMLPVTITNNEMDLIKRWINEGASKE